MSGAQKSSPFRLEKNVRECGFARLSDGFRVYFSDAAFPARFDEIRTILRERRGRVLADKMDAPRRKRLVLAAEIAGTVVVLKHEFFVFRFDRSLKSFFFGSDARNILKVCECARERGFGKIPRIFLAAERFSTGILRESILVTEFLEGAAPEIPLSRERAAEMSALMSECHAHGIISGDVQYGNFIATPDGLKLIDFRGNTVFPWLAKARDRIQLERVFGVKTRRGGAAESIFLFQNTLRNLIRRLRGKEPIPD